MSDDALFDVAPEPRTPQVVDRGEDASPYRARKAPEAHVVHLCGFDEGIVAFRCHDLTVAIEAVRDAIDAGTIPRDLVESLPYVSDLDEHRRPKVGPHPERVWLRWVPEDPAKPTEGGVWERELRGTVGATPAVLFARPNHSSTTNPKGDNHARD